MTSVADVFARMMCASLPLLLKISSCQCGLFSALGFRKAPRDNFDDEQTTSGQHSNSIEQNI